VGKVDRNVIFGRSQTLGSWICSSSFANASLLFDPLLTTTTSSLRRTKTQKKKKKSVAGRARLCRRPRPRRQGLLQHVRDVPLGRAEHPRGRQDAREGGPGAVLGRRVLRGVDREAGQFRFWCRRRRQKGRRRERRSWKTKESCLFLRRTTTMAPRCCPAPCFLLRPFRLHGPLPRRGREAHLLSRAHGEEQAPGVAAEARARRTRCRPQRRSRSERSESKDYRGLSRRSPSCFAASLLRRRCRVLEN
jgi:hypothetical protein